MPPTNDTGSVLTVGPDVNGDHFDVLPGEDYELPEPPRTVLDDETEAQAEETSAEDGEREFDPGDHNVDEVNDYLNDAPEDERARVLDAEETGLGRKGILKGPHAAKSEEVGSSDTADTEGTQE